MSAIEIVGNDLMPVEGIVTVELADADSGRLRHRETSHNFLSLQSLKVAKWWQRFMWGMYNPVEVVDANGVKPTEMPWFPAQHIAYWNDASAEDSANEDRIAKEVVGWASRHPVGSPTGKRGVVNISESFFSESAAKWVFDWVTSQGNGTFQSVGWTRMDETNGFPRGRWPEDDSVSFTNAGNSTAMRSVPIWWDAGTSAWNLTEFVSASSTVRIVSAPAGGGATTTICTLAASSWAAATGVGLIGGLARLGTDVITCGEHSTGPILMRSTSAGATTYRRIETALGSGKSYNDCTVDGSGNIWTAGSDGVMRRHNSADGTISASVTPAFGATALASIAYDPTDGNFWIGGNLAGGAGNSYAKVDGSGNAVGLQISLVSSNLTVPSTSPFTGNYTVPRSGAREPFTFTPWTGSIQTGATLNPAVSRDVQSLGATNSPGATVKNGELWLGQRQSSVDGGCNRASALRGGTLGTRTKLASPITKTSAQTLKITYQFNFS